MYQSCKANEAHEVHRGRCNERGGQTSEDTRLVEQQENGTLRRKESESTQAWLPITARPQELKLYQGVLEWFPGATGKARGRWAVLALPPAQQGHRIPTLQAALIEVGALEPWAGSQEMKGFSVEPLLPPQPLFWQLAGVPSTETAADGAE